MTLRQTSLGMRLASASLAWVLLSLVLTGVLLVWLFRSHIERRFDAALHDHLEELAAAAELDAAGLPVLSWEPADRRFKPPLSGWYWEVRSGGGVLRASSSLDTATLPAPTPQSGQPATYHYISGPAGERLRAITQAIVLPSSAEPITVVVAGPCADIHADVSRFAGTLALSLGLLGVILGALVVLQVRYGLRPLGALQAALNAVRRGTRDQLDRGGAPGEVLPLIDEVNALLRQRQAMTERARCEAGDLAHALKTPIAVIGNEAARIGGEAGDILKAEINRMRHAVEHHLVRARAAAGQLSPHARTPLGDVLADIRFSVERLYPGKTLEIGMIDDAQFAGDADDLGEMIGNLTDNAGKWSRSRIVISAAVVGQRLSIAVDDDGPGLDEAGCAAAMTRGGRLDTDKPGHGIGLSIVAYLAELYSGRLLLSASPLGGLRAELNLPAAGAEEVVPG